MPAPGDGDTHEEQAALGARGMRANYAGRGLTARTIFSFSRYSSGHLPSGIEEDCKGQECCGRRHPFAKPFLQSQWAYSKQAGELFQAQIMCIQKAT